MDPIKFRSKYVWTAIWIIIGFLLGFIVLILYRVPNQIRIGSALIWATGFFFSGCLMGFIFGVPKVISNLSTPITGAPLTDSQQRAAIQENNNLTDISDWLTKVLVGATLVQLKSIPPFVLHVARRMGEGLTTPPAVPEAAIILSAGILVYYSSFGFISGYLTMRLVIYDFLTTNDNSTSEGKNGEGEMPAKG